MARTKTVTVSVVVDVDLDDYLIAMGTDDLLDVVSYTVETVLCAAGEQMDRQGWGAVRPVKS